LANSIDHVCPYGCAVHFLDDKFFNATEPAISNANTLTQCTL
jgi:hypothetical protein